MNHFQFIDCIKRVDYFIRSQGTGTAKELAYKLGVNRSIVFDYFNHMREKGAEISFDKKKKTFYYVNNFTLSF